MEQSAFSELLDILRTSAAVVTTVAVVAFFATLAAILWAWRRMALDDGGEN